MTDIYLHFMCAHYGPSSFPVRLKRVVRERMVVMAADGISLRATAVVIMSFGPQSVLYCDCTTVRLYTPRDMLKGSRQINTTHIPIESTEQKNTLKVWCRWV